MTEHRTAGAAGASHGHSDVLCVAVKDALSRARAPRGPSFPMPRKPKDQPIPVDKRDHEHTCCVCGGVWRCVWFVLKKCKSGGVLKAVQVNEGGPYCATCQADEMEARLRAWRSRMAVPRA